MAKFFKTELNKKVENGDDIDLCDIKTYKLYRVLGGEFEDHIVMRIKDDIVVDFTAGDHWNDCGYNRRTHVKLLVRGETVTLTVKGKVNND